MQLRDVTGRGRMHTGEKPFVCPVCRHRSARMSNLNAHIRKSHGLSWQEAERQYGISAKAANININVIVAFSRTPSTIAQRRKVCVSVGYYSILLLMQVFCPADWAADPA